MEDSPAQPRRARGRPRAFNDTGDQNVIKALDRALGLMAQLADGADTTLTALAARMDESPATLYRALFTFEKHGFAELDPETQSWHVGAEAFRVGATFLRRTSLVERTRPVLRELMAATGETANLGIETGGDVLFVSQVETQASIRAFFPPGTRSSAHASGIGKVLLANLPADRRETLLARPLETFTAQTIATPDALRGELATIRARGFAVDNEEKNDGMRCIAAPIRNALGECVAGISVSGPTSRVGADQVTALAGQVMAAAVKVSAALGYRGPAPDDSTPPTG